MTGRHAIALLVVLAVVAAPRRAFGDDPAAPPEQHDPIIVETPSTGALRLRTPSIVTTDGGSSLRLPPGYFLDEPTWGLVDAEFGRLQAAETRLAAENKSLRAAAAKPARSGWVLALGVALAAGAGGGWYLHHRFSN